jgi:hypothetical protein
MKPTDNAEKIKGKRGEVKGKRHEARGVRREV